MNQEKKKNRKMLGMCLIIMFLLVIQLFCREIGNRNVQSAAYTVEKMSIKKIMADMAGAGLKVGVSGQEGLKESEADTADGMAEEAVLWQLKAGRAKKLDFKQLKAATVDECIIPWVSNKEDCIMAGRDSGNTYILYAKKKEGIRKIKLSKILEDANINAEEFTISDICAIESDFYITGYSKNGRLLIIKTENGRKYTIQKARNPKASKEDSFKLYKTEEGFLLCQKKYEKNAGKNIIKEENDGSADSDEITVKEGIVIETSYYYSKDLKKWRRIILPIQEKRDNINTNYAGSRNGVYYFTAYNKSAENRWQYETEDFKKFRRIEFFPEKDARITQNGLGYGVNIDKRKLTILLSTPSFNRIAKRIVLSYPKGVENSLMAYKGIFTSSYICFFVEDIKGLHLFVSSETGEVFKKYDTALKAGNFSQNGIYRGRYYLTGYENGLIATRDGFKHYVVIDFNLKDLYITCQKKRELLSGYDDKGQYVTYSLVSKDWLDEVMSSTPDS